MGTKTDKDIQRIIEKLVKRKGLVRNESRRSDSNENKGFGEKKNI